MVIAGRVPYFKALQIARSLMPSFPQLRPRQTKIEGWFGTESVELFDPQRAGVETMW
jgi:hypothetical protein